MFLKKILQRQKIHIVCLKSPLNDQEKYSTFLVRRVGKGGRASQADKENPLLKHEHNLHVRNPGHVDGQDQQLEKRQ